MNYCLALLKNSASAYDKARDELNAQGFDVPDFQVKYDALMKLRDQVTLDALLFANHIDAALLEEFS